MSNGLSQELDRAPNPPPPPTVAAKRRRWWAAAAVVALLGFYVAMSLSAARQKGLSFDEGEEIAIGYNVWLNRDFRMESANGDLVKRWATLPLLVSRPNFVSQANPYWRSGGPYEVGFLFFFNQGNDPQAILWRCRVMVVILGVATALLVFVCSRELFGLGGGLISLTLFVSSPSMLAFGGIVSTEMTEFLTLLGAAWASWRLMHRVTWSRLALGLLFAALLALSKPTGVVILPLAIIMGAIRLVRGQPLRWELGVPRLVHSRARQLGIMLGLLIAHIAFGWAAVWACYDFRYVASPHPDDPGIVFRTQQGDAVDPRIRAFLHWSQRTHFLPEGYLHGIQWLLQQNTSQAAFMDGKWKYGAWPTFFPYAIWAKTHPASLLLFAAAIVALGWRFRADRRPPKPDADAPSGTEMLYGAVPFLGLIVIYFATALNYGLNIGFRHILPIYPCAYVLCGATALLWTSGRLIGQLGRAALGLLLLWHVGSAVAIRPDFLAYFSPVVGGSKEGYKHLVDSSLDWGMDLPELKRWLDVHNPKPAQPVFLAYFGVDNPDHYGITSFRLPGRPNWRLGASFPYRPGIYAISATLFQGIGLSTIGPWNKTFEIAYRRLLQEIDHYDRTLGNPVAHAALLAKYPQSYWDSEYETFDYLRFARLCAWLRHGRPPDDNVGHSILIWKLSVEDIFAAGLGPPAELADQPLHR